MKLKIHRAAFVALKSCHAERSREVSEANFTAQSKHPCVNPDSRGEMPGPSPDAGAFCSPPEPGSVPTFRAAEKSRIEWPWEGHDFQSCRQASYTKQPHAAESRCASTINIYNQDYASTPDHPSHFLDLLVCSSFHNRARASVPANRNGESSGWAVQNCMENERPSRHSEASIFQNRAATIICDG